MIALVLGGVAHGRVLAADHLGRPEGDGLGWTSTIAIAGPGDVPLATPIPRDELVNVSGGVPVWDGEWLVAITPWAHGDRIVVDVRQRDRASARPALPVERGALQQVAIEGLRFHADPVLGLQDRIGWSAPEGTHASDRRAAFRQLGDAWEHRQGASIVVVDRALPEGVPGEITPVGLVPLQVVLGAVAASLALLGALWGGHRALDALARRERIEAYFRESELRARGPGGSAP